MNKRISFEKYVEDLCREHKMVAHSEAECHFSNLISDFDNKLQRIMHYPSVGIDTEGFTINGGPGFELRQDNYNLYFLDHVRDHGDLNEKLHAFAITALIMHDFIARFKRDRVKGIEPMERFSMDGATATRIEFADNALYGWVISFPLAQPINSLNCNNNFNS